MEITYEHVPPRSKICACRKSLGRDRLRDDLVSLLESPKYTDITFCFPDRKIAAHRVILSARVPYFANMLESGMEEVTSNEVHIQDVESGVFKAVLQYIYSGVAPTNLDKIALKLLVAADK